MDRSKQKVIGLLVEAHSNELASIGGLKAHLSIAERGSYRSTVETHLRETEQHADKIARRLTRLGFRQSLPSMARGAVLSLVKQGLSLSMGPLDLVRGNLLGGNGDVKEKMLRNAIDEAMTEGLEIGAYDAIEAFALSVGDHETAELVAEIRLDEERMFDSLRKEIPGLAAQVAASQIPPTQLGSEEPWPGYDELTVEEILVEVDESSEALILVVRDYEGRNKNRSSVLKATDRDGLPV
jgi:ferritin-like metal-binding protein YciE